MDGSSKKFVEAIKEIGLKNSSTPIKIIKILNKVEILNNNKSISIEPTNATLEIDFEIKFSNKFIEIKEIQLMFTKTISLTFIIQEHFVFLRM